MNVEYRCPKCGGSKHFALPGGTGYTCRHCADKPTLVQIEDTTAPDFLNVEEDGQTKSQDLILPNNERRRGEPIVDRDAPPDPVISMELDMWREQFETELGEPVDKRWGAARIQEEILRYRDEKGNAQAHEGDTLVVPTDADDTLADPPNAGEIVESIPEPREGDEDGTD